MRETGTTAEVWVSVVVPCRNEVAHIGGLLESILAQEDLAGPIEVLVADGMSDDGTREIIAGHTARTPGIRAIDNPEHIVSTGLNRAIRAATGRYILRMDVHTTYATDYIAASVRALEESGADNAGGAARVRAEGGWQAAIAAAYESPFAVGGASFHFADHEGWVDTVPYGCWRRSYLLEIGLFDEDLVRNQDDELNLRIIRAGGRIWQSRRIRSWYHPRRTLSQLGRQYFQYGFWKVAVLRKHRIPASLRHLVPVAFILALLGLPLLALIWGPALMLWGGIAGSYALFVLGGATVIAARGGWKMWPRLIPVLATYHFSYGMGWLVGLLKAGRGRREGVGTSLSR